MRQADTADFSAEVRAFYERLWHHDQIVFDASRL
jgi:hypothetical protein